MASYMPWDKRYPLLLAPTYSIIKLGPEVDPIVLGGVNEGEINISTEGEGTVSRLLTRSTVFQQWKRTRSISYSSY